MNKELVEIAFVLDRSGSMADCRESAIAGFNQFLRDQREAAGKARLTLVLFDDRYEVPVASLPIEEVIELDTDTYVPRGSTALLDAIGTTIDQLGERLAAMAEPERPGQVIVTILTDGLENASTRFGWHDISRRIGHQTDVYHWRFLFLGANQDAIATAARMSIAEQDAASYVSDQIGLCATSKAVSKKLRALRNCANGSATAEETAALNARMDRLVEEEDRRQRGKPNP